MNLGCTSFFKRSAVRFVIEMYVWNLDVPLCPFCRVVLLCQLPPQCGLRGCPWDNQTIDCVCKFNSIPESQICLILVLPSSSSHYLYCEFLLIERKFVLPFFVFFFFPFIILKITESRSRQNIYGNSSFFRLEISLLLFGSTNFVCQHEFCSVPYTTLNHYSTTVTILIFFCMPIILINQQ